MTDLAVTPNGQPATDRWRLSPAELELDLHAEDLGFATTAELEPLTEIAGQDRALRALQFGLAVRHRGYNVFVSGMSGTGRKELVQRLLEARASQEPTPDDWVFVFNFDAPDRPLALRLPAGQGVGLRDDLQRLVERFRRDLPAALKAKDFNAERERLAEIYGRRSEELFNELTQHARKLDLLIRRRPEGMLLFIPLKDGQPLSAAEAEKLTPQEKEELERRQKELGEFAVDTLARQQELLEQMQREVEEIIRGLAGRILDPLIARLKQTYTGEAVTRWLDRAREDMLEHLQQFRDQEAPEEDSEIPQIFRSALRRDPFLRYQVNVIADHAQSKGAPVVIESAPTYKSLFGTIEHDVNLFGRVSTDFTRIKPGALLRANGGYLVLDMADALTEPLVWKNLKRVLKSGELLTDAYEPLALLAPTSLHPQPIPLDLKIVAVGSTELYYLLQFYDDDFRELFRVRADFGPETKRTAASQREYARFVAAIVQQEGLPAFDAAAVVEIIRFGAREAGHRGKLSVEFGKIADLVREAGHWARAGGAAVVTAAHVRQSLEEQTFRTDRLAAKIRELIAEGVLRVEVEGQVVGQVNGLSVLDLGDFRFGRPARVSAAVGIGQEGLVNIERESDLSGSTYDKGVLILEGYLRNRYARTHPIALSASLAFEQSYGWVEGDSAAAAELYCLLSAISGLPLRQDIAVTGSVDQQGRVQAVGGVNEKVEGFFDVCRLRGLTGTQGVCLPRANHPHLVLRQDVLQAVAEGKFHLWAVSSIDEGLELLTGVPAGDLETAGTVHYRVDQRLREILNILQQEPQASTAPRIHLGAAAAPKPAVPPLPGDRG